MLLLGAHLRFGKHWVISMHRLVGGPAALWYALGFAARNAEQGRVRRATRRHLVLS